jgi:hypothetical protein
MLCYNGLAVFDIPSALFFAWLERLLSKVAAGLASALAGNRTRRFPLGKRFAPTFEKIVLR